MASDGRRTCPAGMIERSGGRQTRDPRAHQVSWSARSHHMTVATSPMIATTTTRAIAPAVTGSTYVPPAPARIAGTDHGNHDPQPRTVSTWEAAIIATVHEGCDVTPPDADEEGRPGLCVR